MKALKILAVAGIAYFLLLKKAANNLRYYFKGVGIDFDGITPILNISLGVANGSNQKINIRSVVGDVYAGQSYLGTVTAFNPVILLPFSENTINLKVRLSFIGLVSDIIKKIQNKGGVSYELRFVGIAYAEGFNIPLNLKFAV